MSERRLDEALDELRRTILTMDPADAGLDPGGRDPAVWAAVMDWGEIGSLISLADGTTSLYLFGGGGIIGGGEHDAAAAATRAWLRVLGEAYPSLSPTDDISFPAADAVRFLVRSVHGTRAAEAPEEALGEGDHRWSALFYAAQDVITELRLLDEAAAEDV